MVTDGETVLVRKGYCPVETEPGYDCCNLNSLDGQDTIVTRVWLQYVNDPKRTAERRA